MALYRLTYFQLLEISSLWKRIATEYNGNFKQIHSKEPSAIAGAFNESTRLELYIPYGTLNAIIVTAGEQHPLKVNYLFEKYLGFNLEIYTEDIFEKITKILGGQDLTVGIPEFDKKYRVKTNNTHLANKLLDRRVIERILDLEIHSLKITSKNESELFMMPFIKEEDETKMKILLRFTIDLIVKIIEYNNYC